MRNIRNVATVAVIGLGCLLGCSRTVTRAPEQAETVKCLSALNAIGAAAAIYRNTHDAYPPDLQTLVAERDLPPQALRCPAAERAGRTCDFFYAQPSKTSVGSALMACDLAGNHPDGHRGCLTVSGSVLWLTAGEFQAALAKGENAAFATALAAAGG